MAESEGTSATSSSSEPTSTYSSKLALLALLAFPAAALVGVAVGVTALRRYRRSAAAKDREFKVLDNGGTTS